MPLVTLVFLLASAGFGLAVGAWFGSRLAQARAQAESAQSASAQESAAAQIGALQAELAERTRQAEELRREAAALQQRAVRAETEAARLPQVERDLKAAVEAAEGDKQTLRFELTAARTEAARMGTALDAERRNSEEKLKTLQGAREDLSNQFKALAQEILDQKAKAFTEQNQANLTHLLTPIREKFGEFQQKVESLEKDSVAGRSELKTQIEQLRTLNERLSQDANNLVSALKGSSKTQGDWGEFILEQLLESAGLRKGEQYRVQESFTREDGTRAKPDVILYLPEGKHLIVDAKVSLLDYNSYCSEQDEPTREAALARHLGSIRNHIKELSQRNYHALHGLKSIDFVVMFVPIEPAFMLALARDGRLWQEAWERNVLLVSPSTLLFVVRTVAQLWRQEQQTRNVQEIVKRGGELYDKLAAFAIDLTKVGDSIEAARRSYEEAYRKLAQGKGNAIRQAEMLKQLGIKTTKSLPIALVDQAMDAPLELAAVAEEEG